MRHDINRLELKQSNSSSFGYHYSQCNSNTSTSNIEQQVVKQKYVMVIFRLLEKCRLVMDRIMIINKTRKMQQEHQVVNNSELLELVNKEEEECGDDGYSSYYYDSYYDNFCNSNGYEDHDSDSDSYYYSKFCKFDLYTIINILSSTIETTTTTTAPSDSGSTSTNTNMCARHYTRYFNNIKLATSVLQECYTYRLFSLNSRSLSLSSQSHSNTNTRDNNSLMHTISILILLVESAINYNSNSSVYNSSSNIFIDMIKLFIKLYISTSNDTSTILFIIRTIMTSTSISNNNNSSGTNILLFVFKLLFSIILDDNNSSQCNQSCLLLKQLILGYPSSNNSNSNSNASYHYMIIKVYQYLVDILTSNSDNSTMVSFTFKQLCSTNIHVNALEYIISNIRNKIFTIVPSSNSSADDESLTSSMFIYSSHIKTSGDACKRVQCIKYLLSMKLLSNMQQQNQSQQQTIQSTVAASPVPIFKSKKFNNNLLEATLWLSLVRGGTSSSVGDSPYTTASNLLIFTYGTMMDFIMGKYQKQEEIDQQIVLVKPLVKQVQQQAEEFNWVESMAMQQALDALEKNKRFASALIEEAKKIFMKHGLKNTWITTFKSYL